MVEQMEEETWRKTQLEILEQDDMDLDVVEAVKFMTNSKGRDKASTSKKAPT